MGSQRAIMKGTIASVVQTRSVFTANIVEVGGDTPAILWDAYLNVLYGEITDLQSNVCATYAYELQAYDAGHWVPFLEVTFVRTGTVSGEQLANAVACVLIGKAAGLRHIGRKFISALGEQAVVGNVLDSSVVATAAAALLAYIAPFVGIGGGQLYPGVVDASGTFHEFVGGVVSSILGSIRRRKPGSGM
jgi:hypothetical protein